MNFFKLKLWKNVKFFKLKFWKNVTIFKLKFWKNLTFYKLKFLKNLTFFQYLLQKIITWINSEKYKYRQSVNDSMHFLIECVGCKSLHLKPNKCRLPASFDHNFIEMQEFRPSCSNSLGWLTLFANSLLHTGAPVCICRVLV